MGRHIYSAAEGVRLCGVAQKRRYKRRQRSSRARSQGKKPRSPENKMVDQQMALGTGDRSKSQYHHNVKREGLDSLLRYVRICIGSLAPKILGSLSSKACKVPWLSRLYDPYIYKTASSIRAVHSPLIILHDIRLNTFLTLAAAALYPRRRRRSSLP
jgi:hypothetical protein